jgi:hypothetical protein
MKIIKNLVLGLVILGFTFLLSGCYGSFALTKKVYNWNGKVGNKYVNEAVFLGLSVIQVYSATFFIDGIVLNSVEFWTGSNPIALKDGENHFKFNGKDVKLLMSENHAVIYNSSNNKIEATLDYNKFNQSWYITRNGNTQRLMSISGNELTAYDSTGKVIDTKLIASK